MGNYGNVGVSFSLGHILGTDYREKVTGNRSNRGYISLPLAQVEVTYMVKGI
jgi:hypothetical protein